jgi:NUMOD4 motif
MTIEEWRTIEGFEKYQVSNLGKVKSFVGCREGKILSSHNDPDKYVFVGLCNDNNAKATTISVHKLVANAFIPNPNGYKYNNHKNGKKSDNSVDNIEWCTQSHNVKHGYDALGRESVKGELVGSAKLTNDEVIKIYDLVWHSDLTIFEICKMFNVKESTVFSIKVGRTWSHLTGHVYIPNNNSDVKHSYELTKEQVIDIYNKLWNVGLSIKSVSEIYNLPTYIISNIRNGYTHKDITQQILKINHGSFTNLISKKQKHRIMGWV